MSLQSKVRVSAAKSNCNERRGEGVSWGVGGGALHRHAVGELLECLTVEGDGHSGVGVEGELHPVLNLGLPSVLHGRVRVIFVPADGRSDSCQRRSHPASNRFRCCESGFFYFYLTRRRESFLMLTRLLRVLTGSWGAGVTYGNYSSWIRS